MTLDESGLHWEYVESERITHRETGAVSSMRRYRCVDDPAISRIVQQQNEDSPLVESYYIDGLAQVYHTPDEVLAAREANPA